MAEVLLRPAQQKLPAGRLNWTQSKIAHSVQQRILCNSAFCAKLRIYVTAYSMQLRPAQQKLPAGWLNWTQSTDAAFCATAHFVHSRFVQNCEFGATAHSVQQRLLCNSAFCATIFCAKLRILCKSALYAIAACWTKAFCRMTWLNTEHRCRILRNSSFCAFTFCAKLWIWGNSAFCATMHSVQQCILHNSASQQQLAHQGSHFLRMLHRGAQRLCFVLTLWAHTFCACCTEVHKSLLWAQCGSSIPTIFATKCFLRQS